MITKEEIKKIGDELLKNSDIEYETLYGIDKIALYKNDKILSGNKQGDFVDVYVYLFTQIWGLDEKTLGLHIDAKSGEPLYIVTPHGYIDIEKVEE